MTIKTAIVTGGIGGIGTAIVEELDTRGFNVIALHLPSEKAKAIDWQSHQKAEDRTVSVYACDVSDFLSCQQMAEDLVAVNGTPSVLVNAAGITRDGVLKKMDPNNWQAVIDTNLGSVFNVCRVFIEGMIEAQSGSIVNIASVNGQKGQFGQCNYSASKAGIHGLTMSLAQEVAAKGITVNTVSPGYIDTVMTQAIREDIRQQIVTQIPVRRMGQPADIANIIGFLCSNEARYITGANIPVNGGLYMS